MIIVENCRVMNSQYLQGKFNDKYNVLTALSPSNQRTKNICTMECMYCYLLVELCAWCGFLRQFRVQLSIDSVQCTVYSVHTTSIQLERNFCEIVCRLPWNQKLNFWVVNLMFLRTMYCLVYFKYYNINTNKLSHKLFHSFFIFKLWFSMSFWLFQIGW